MRNKKKKDTISKNKKTENKNISEEETTVGIIKSINTKAIYPIYLLVKGKIVRISVFNGIRPASLD